MNVLKIMEIVARDVLMTMDHFIVNVVQVSHCLAMGSVVKVRKQKNLRYIYILDTTNSIAIDYICLVIFSFL